MAGSCDMVNSTFSVSWLWVFWWLWLWWSKERFRNGDELVFDIDFGFEESWLVEVCCRCWWRDVFVRKARDDGCGV